MQALILVGGEGTRLRPLTLTRPKPALRLVDRPFIRFMVDWVAHHGVTEVVMACGFRPDDLREALGDRIPGGPSIRYVEEPIVSSDIVGDPHSCIFDSELTMSMGKLVKIFGWYDNEWGYSNRMIDFMIYAGKKLGARKR